MLFPFRWGARTVKGIASAENGSFRALQISRATFIGKALKGAYVPQMILDQVPVLSMKHGATPGFADNLGQSFEHFGFAMICDHGLDPAMVERGWALAKALFDQPDEVKRASHVTGGGGQRGYPTLGPERARNGGTEEARGGKRGGRKYR